MNTGTVIIVTHNSETTIKDCLLSLRKELERTSFKIVVVDNCSTDDTVPIITHEFPEICLVQNDENGGFGAGNNTGFQDAEGEWVFFLNPDTITVPGCLEKLIEALDSDKKIGCIAPAITDNDGKTIPSFFPFTDGIISILTAFGLQHFLNLNKIDGRVCLGSCTPQKPAEVDRVLGAAMMIPMHAMKRVKSFDEIFFLYSEEEDLCYRLKREGLKIIYFPLAKVQHFGAISTEPVKPVSIAASNWSRYLYLRKHANPLGAELSRWVWIKMLFIRLILSRLLSRGEDRRTLTLGYLYSIRSLLMPGYFDRVLRPQRKRIAR